MNYKFDLKCEIFELYKNTIDYSLINQIFPAYYFDKSK